jgi:hypothetical protein
MCQRLEQLDIIQKLPLDIEDCDSLINRAVDVRSACMLYIASHISHNTTRLGIFGALPLYISVDITQGKLSKLFSQEIDKLRSRWHV